MERAELSRRWFNGLLIFFLLELAGFCLLSLARNVFTGGPHVSPERVANTHQMLDIAHWIWLAISALTGFLWGFFCKLQPRSTQRYQPERNLLHHIEPASDQPEPERNLLHHIEPASDQPEDEICYICGRTREEAEYLTECDFCERVVCSKCVYHDAPDHHWTTCHNCGARW